MNRRPKEGIPVSPTCARAPESEPLTCKDCLQFSATAAMVRGVGWCNVQQTTVGALAPVTRRKHDGLYQPECFVPRPPENLGRTNPAAAYVASDRAHISLGCQRTFSLCYEPLDSFQARRWLLEPHPGAEVDIVELPGAPGVSIRVTGARLRRSP